MAIMTTQFQNQVPEPTEASSERMRTKKEKGTASSTPAPSPTPRPVPTPQEHGSRFLIWKQDPSTAELGARKVYIPSLVFDGPKDVRIVTELQGTTPVSPNAMGDFVFPAGSAELALLC